MTTIRRMAVPPQDPEPEDMKAVSVEPAEYKVDDTDLPIWAKTSVPSVVAPNISDELSVLVGKSGLTTLDRKPDTTIVPTILPGLNRALRVGGIPASCMVILHGPSKGGKTALALALIRSFQIHGHMAAYIDAEFSLEKLFSSQLGIDNSQLIYKTPETFEETTGVVEDLINNFRRGREKKKIHPNRCLIIVTDSVNKLVPADELEKLRVAGKQYPLRALLTTLWFDKLTPIVGNNPILFAAIAHEKVKMDAAQFGKKYRVKGGESLIYDSTIAFRVTMTRILKSRYGNMNTPIGQLHEVRVEKSKVGISHELFRFVMSNGKGKVPIGFDHCRGALEEIRLRGDQPLSLVKSGPTWKCDAFPNGSLKGDKAVSEWLYDHPDLLDQVVAELHATATDVIVRTDDDGDDDE